MSWLENWIIFTPMPILKKIHLVSSGDGKARYRVVWGHRKFTYFADPQELRALARKILLLIKTEPDAIKHLGTTSLGTGEVGAVPIGQESESPEV